MKRVPKATAALIALLLGGCKTEEAVKPSIPEAEGSGRRINVISRGVDTSTTGSDSADTGSTSAMDLHTTAP